MHLGDLRFFPQTEPLQHHLQQTVDYFVRPLHLARTYRRADFMPDLISGLTVTTVLLPQSIAYALIADLPPEMGLYAAIVGTIVGALWGSSRHLQTGPTNAASLLVLSVLLTVAQPGTTTYLLAAGMLAVMVGIARLAMGVARLGVLVNFVSVSVIAGYTIGAAILIAANQLRYLFRIPGPTSTDFLVTLGAFFTNLPQTHWLSLALGLGTVAFILIMRRLRPKLPAMLISMAISAIVVALVSWDGDSRGIVVLGAMPQALPPLAALPVFNLELIGKLSTGALALTIVGLVEATSIARTIAAHTGQRLDNNQEFVGQGLANIAAGLFSGYSVSGSFSRSAVLYTSGGRSFLASVISGAATLVSMLLLAPFVAFLARPALAGTLLVTAYLMIDWRLVARIARTSRGESAIMVATLLATLLLPLEFAILAGVLVSFARYIILTSMPNVVPLVPDDDFNRLKPRPDKPQCPQLGVLEIQGALYFGATQHVEDSIRAHLYKNPGQRFLILRMSSVDHCDLAGLQMLEVISRMYTQRGGDVYLLGVQEAVREKMRLSGLETNLGASHFFESERDALEFLFYRALDPTVCIYECPVRVWHECQNLPQRVIPNVKFPALALQAPVREIAPRELWRLLRSPHAPCVLDLREPREFHQGHVPGAQSYPLPRVLTEAFQMLTTTEIILACRTGRRSLRAAAALQQQGITSFRILRGGMVAWELDGLLTATEM